MFIKKWKESIYNKIIHVNEKEEFYKEIKELLNEQNETNHELRERLIHIEDRLQIVDEDKIEDMRSRLIHIEDKVNVVMNQNTGDIYLTLREK